jgi:hypothetical protein
MFKELEPRTEFRNLVHYSEVTEFYVLFMQVFTSIFLGRTGSHLSALLKLVLLVLIIMQIKVLEIWMVGQKSVTLWNRPWKNSLSPNQRHTLLGSPHSW